MHKQIKDRFIENFTEAYSSALEQLPDAEFEFWFDENLVAHQMWGIYGFSKGETKVYFSVNGSVLLDIFDVVAKIEEKFNIKVNGFSTYCGKVEAAYSQHQTQEVQNASS